MTLELSTTDKCFTSDPLANFLYALKASETRRQYPKRLEYLMNFIKIDGLDLQAKSLMLLKKAKDNPEWLQNTLIWFVSKQKQRALAGEISESTIPNYYKALKLFCEMNDIILNWKKISRGMPKGRHAANDRVPTIGELKKLIEFPDRRIKPIVLTMVSTGIRVGAWDTMKWKHIIPIHDDLGIVIAAKLTVYPGDCEEYFTFMTSEAFCSLNEWMDFRNSCGEKITKESWVMRDTWQSTNIRYGHRLGIAAYPRQLKSNGIRSLIGRAIWEQGIRNPLKSGEKRHEWKTLHGFRKWFKTQTEKVMKSINIELLMGHAIGVSNSYYKPQPRELLEDYLNATDLLTINEENRLQRKLIDLTEKNKDSECIIKGKLLEKDVQIQELEKKQDQLERLVQSLIDSGQLKPN